MGLGSCLWQKLELDPSFIFQLLGHFHLNSSQWFTFAHMYVICMFVYNNKHRVRQISDQINTEWNNFGLFWFLCRCGFLHLPPSPPCVNKKPDCHSWWIWKTLCWDGSHWNFALAIQTWSWFKAVDFWRKRWFNFYLYSAAFHRDTHKCVYMEQSGQCVSETVLTRLKGNK